MVYLSPSLLNHKARSLRSSSLVGLPDASSVSCMFGCKEVRRPRRKLMMSGGTLYNRLLLLAELMESCAAVTADCSRYWRNCPNCTAMMTEMLGITTT